MNSLRKAATVRSVLGLTARCLSSSSVKVGLCQMLVTADKTANIQNAINHINKANEAELVV